MVWSEKLQGKRPFDKERRAAAAAEGAKKTASDANTSKTTNKKKQKPLLTDVPGPKPSAAAAELKIKPGESMSDFSRRVNEALPVGRAKSEGPSRGALRAQKKRARVEKEQAAARQRKIEKGELDDEEDADVRWSQKGTTTRNKTTGKREVSPDPWAHLQKPAPKFGDVADRPPELNLSAKILNNVPKSAGSLAKRYMLQSERQKVIDGYRALMESKRAEE